MKMCNIHTIWVPQWQEVGAEPWPVLCMGAGLFEVWCKYDGIFNTYDVCALLRYGDETVFSPCIGQGSRFRNFEEAMEYMPLLADLLIDFSNKLDKLTSGVV